MFLTNPRVNHYQMQMVNNIRDQRQQLCGYIKIPQILRLDAVIHTSMCRRGSLQSFQQVN